MYVFEMNSILLLTIKLRYFFILILSISEKFNKGKSGILMRNDL